MTAEIWLLDRFDVMPEAHKLIRELELRGRRALWVDWDTLTPSCQPPGAVHVDGRWEVPRLGLVRSRLLTRTPAAFLPDLYAALGLLEDAGVRLVNRVESLVRYENRIRQLSALAVAGFRVPVTRAARTIEQVDAFLTEYEDIVVKPSYGHAAIDVLRLRPGGHGARPDSSLGVRERTTVWHLLDRYGTLCLQQFVPNGGRDLRVQVIGQTLVSCLARASTAPDGSVLHTRFPFATVPAALGPEDERAIRSAVAALGFDVASVELVDGPDGPTIIEVNPTVETWAGLEITAFDRTSAGVTREFAGLLCDLLETA